MQQGPKTNNQQGFHGKPQKSDGNKDMLLAVLFLIAAGILYYAYQSTPKKNQKANSLASVDSNGQMISNANPSNVHQGQGIANINEQNRNPSSALTKEQTSDIVTRNMQKTAQKLMIERQKVEIENGLYAPDVSSRPKSEVYDNKTTGVDLSVEQTSLQTAKELGRARDEEPRAYSPHDVVQQEMAEQAALGEYQESYKQAYLSQYIENARKKGYEIKLDAQGKVLSVKKIRESSGFNVLAPNSPGTNH